MKQSDSREKLFESSLKTVNVSVNNELSMNSSSNSKNEVNDYFNFYGDRDDDVFHKVISVDNLAYSTLYNDENSDNMLDSKSISQNQSESDMDLVEDISSDDEIYSDTEDGEYFLAVESLEEILDFGSFQSSPCTVVSFQDKHSLTDLDPGTSLRSSEVPNPWDKWEDVDLASFCVFDEMPLEIYDQNAVQSSPVGFVSSSIDIVYYVKDILKRHSSLELLLLAKSLDCDDAASFCSILTDKLQYCQSDTSDSVRYFCNDSFKAINAKQRFFDAAFNNEPCIGSTCVNSCKASNVTNHQLFDVPNSNILNKNVLNIAEATAVSNTPSKISRRMLFPTTFLQNVKDKYENNNSYRKDLVTNVYDISTTPGTENVKYVMVRCLTIRKNYTFLLCIYFHQYISLGERSESVRKKAGYCMKVPLRDGIFWWWNLWNVLCGMFSLVEESV